MNTTGSSRRRKRRRRYKTGGEELHSSYREAAEELNQGEALKRSRPGTKTEPTPESSPGRIYKNIRVSSPQPQSIWTNVRFDFGCASPAGSQTRHGDGAHANCFLCVRVSVYDDIAMSRSKVTGPAASLWTHDQRAGESSVVLQDLWSKV